MTSVLVTGGAGYIGSHAVKALRQRGPSLVVADDFPAGHRQAARHASALAPGNVAVLFTSSERLRSESGWTPRYEDIDPIVEAARRWRDAPPSGYRKAST